MSRANIKSQQGLTGILKSILNYGQLYILCLRALPRAFLQVSSPLLTHYDGFSRVLYIPDRGVSLQF
jgi:hypothetical protein